MKVILITNNFAGGGRERRLVQLMKSLSSRNDCQYEVIILADKTQVDYPEIFKLGCKLTFLSKNDGFIDYHILENKIMEFHPDIVHCWCMNSRMLYHLMKLKRQQHFVLISGYVADGNRIPLFSTEFFTTYASFLLSDHIVSNSMAGLIAKKAPLGKSSVIYNGFDYDRFSKEIDIIYKKEEIGLLPNDFVISMIARFNAAKDWISFIRVAEKLREYKYVKFLAVGKGEDLETIKQEALNLNLNNIIFLGFRKDVEDIVRISDLTMLWSNEKVHAEGVSNSIMESMAAGVPVIASKGGGTSEIIKDRVNGFIVPPADVNAAVEILKDILGKLIELRKVSAAAKNEINCRFLLSQMTENYICLYKKLIQ